MNEGNEQRKKISECNLSPFPIPHSPSPLFKREKILQRLALITGNEGIERLAGSKVMVFGLGGVGSWCAEALVRSGVGALTLVDSDTVCVTNINRQAQATTKTIGEFKARALRSRLLEINPGCRISALCRVFSAESAKEFALEDADYIIDAIDSLTNKLDLIERSAALHKKLFSCMGMAQKLDPTQIRSADIWETSRCPLARLVRNGLRKRNFTGRLTVVYSKERLPIRAEAAGSCGAARCLCSAKNQAGAQEWCSSKKIINGSAVTVTATAGMILASFVINDVLSEPPPPPV
ncbi:MAG: tRNA threonylcarbamoyladenosine dehydratase [Spirochaetaceae bacterium]|jgi:tRNA A37 threonylcarbamoyladenosine dehydratase|nr:tRNA threonylcarbamoyladenosine dehydratase [Spirochaetaceae bacterium]